MLIQIAILAWIFLGEGIILQVIIGMAVAGVGVVQMKGKCHANLVDIFGSILSAFYNRNIKLPIR